MSRNKLYKEIEVNDESSVFCPQEHALEQFAKDGGWDTVEKLCADLGVDKHEMLSGWWFNITHGRLFIQDIAYDLEHETDEAVKRKYRRMLKVEEDWKEQGRLR